MADIYVMTPREDGTAVKLTLEQIEGWGLSGKLGIPGGEGALTVTTAYQKVGTFRRGVDLRARSVAGLPWAIYGRGDEPVWTESTDRPDDLEWLRLRDALYTAEVSLTLFGAAYALKERSGRRPTGLYWYNAASITPNYEEADIPSYTRRITTRDNRWINETILAENILAIFPPDAMREMGPATPDAEAALMSAQVLFDLDSYAAENLRDGLMKTTIATAPGRRPPEEEARRAENWLTRNLWGRGKKREAKIFSGELKLVEVGSNLTNLASKDLAEHHQKTIATALGIPHSLMMSNAANYATAQTDVLQMLTNTSIPDARIIQDAFNEQVLNPLGLDLQFEPERAEAMQVAQDAQAQSTVSLYVAGLIDRNEARIRVNYDPQDDPEDEAPEPEPEVPTDEVPSEEPEDDDAQPVRALDVRRWRAKVEKRGRRVKFMPDALREEEADEIRERLATGLPLEEVFEPPYLPSSF